MKKTISGITLLEVLVNCDVNKHGGGDFLNIPATHVRPELDIPRRVSTYVITCFNFANSITFTHVTKIFL